MHWLNKPMHFPLEVEDALRIIVAAVGPERFFQTVVVAVFRRVAEAEVEITNGPSWERLVVKLFCQRNSAAASRMEGPAKWKTQMNKTNRQWKQHTAAATPCFWKSGW